jgi:hypothetical protein
LPLSIQQLFMKHFQINSILCGVILLTARAHAATSYVQDFNTYANGTTNLNDGTVIASFDGTASVQNGALQLSKVGVGEEYGTYIIPGLTGSSNGWTATFSVRVGSEGQPADGFSFSWGSGISLIGEGGGPADPGGSEDGWGVEVNHLYFGFDTLDNGGGEWGLKIGGANGAQEFSFTNVSGPLIGVEETALGQVSLSWSPVLGASFHTTGFNTNINVTGIPTSGFAVADTNNFAFSARTGGLTENLSIDNLNIQSVPEPTSAGLLLFGLLASFTLKRSRKA